MLLRIPIFFCDFSGGTGPLHPYQLDLCMIDVKVLSLPHNFAHWSVILAFPGHRHSELIVKYNIGLKTLLQQGISEPVFYGDLVYKFKRIVGKPNFNDEFKKIVKRYTRVGYNLDIMRQSACLVLNPITVYSYGFLFNCTTVGQASDSMTALT